MTHTKGEMPSMYGLVNQAIKGLITSEYGREAWDEIARRCPLEVPDFDPMEPYADEMTYSLVAMAAEVTDVPADRLLEAFGEHWTLHVADKGYGPLLDSLGPSLHDCFRCLDALHVAVKKSYPALVPLSFRFDALDSSSGLLHYVSSRAGLAPMVVGLIRGLASRYEVEVEIEQVESRDDGADHDVFRVTTLPG